LRQPFLQHRGDVRAQRRASHLSPFSEATDVGASAELHVLAAKCRDLTIAEARLNRDEQQGLIPPSDPCARIRCCDKSGGLFHSQKLHWGALVALRRDRKDALTLQGEGWFADRYILEEGMDGSQTVVSRPRAVATVEFEMLKELYQEGNIEIFDEQFGWRAPESLTAELKQ
jgi:hypothetical protein